MNTKNRGTRTTIGPFPASAKADGFYTNWFKVDGHPAVQYCRADKTWAQIVEHTEAETGIRSYDVTWSGEPDKTRTIWCKDEAGAVATWILR